MTNQQIPAITFIVKRCSISMKLNTVNARVTPRIVINWIDSLSTILLH
jgi:hypothetical protein